MSDASSPNSGEHRKKSKRLEDKDSTKKQSRKVGEKQRRDKLKSYLSVLAQEVPWISDSNQRVDRSQILKLTVNYLKFHHGVKEKRIALQNWKPNFLSSDTLRQCLSEATGGFVMVVAHTGTVVFVSEGISSILGHSPVNVIGLPISNILHTDDCETFSRQFQTADKNVFMCESMPADQERTQINTFKNNHRSFLVRMQILLENSNNQKYEDIHVLGKISTEGPKAAGKKVNSPDKQYTWLVAVGRPVRNRVMHELSVMGLDKLEWCSQHSMDGTVLFADQRVSQCLGLFSEENAGLSCYHYIVPEDIQAVTISHMKIMTDDEVPHTIFRLKVPNQSTKYIVSRSVIVRDTWTKEAKFISSINIITEKTEGDKLLEEQKKKVDALIAVTKHLSLQEDSPEVIPHEEDRLDNIINNPPVMNDFDTSNSLFKSDKDFESDGSTTFMISTEVSFAENRSSTGPKKLGTPLLKSLLVGDITDTSSSSWTSTGQAGSETSPISIHSHSISSGSPQPINSTSCDGSASPQLTGKEDIPLAHNVESFNATSGERSILLRNNAERSKDIESGSNINKDLISMTELEPSCCQVNPAMFSIQRVRNWAASLSEAEAEMDIARSTDLGDSPGACSGHSNLTHPQSHSDTSSPTHSSLDTSQPTPDQSNLQFSEPESVQSHISYGQSSPVSNFSPQFQPGLPFHQTGPILSSLPYNQKSLRHSNISHSPTYPTESSLSCRASYADSCRLYNQSSEVQPNLHFPTSSPESCISCDEPRADQSYLPLHWSSHTHSKEIPSQQNPIPSNLPSPMLVHQPFSQQCNSEQSPHYNQLLFEQANRTYNDIDLLSTVLGSSSYDQPGNVDDQPSEGFQQHYTHDQSGMSQYMCEQHTTDYGQVYGPEQGNVPISVPGSTSCKLDPIQGNTGFCSTEFNISDNDNTHVSVEKTFNSGSSQGEEATTASTDVVQRMKDSAHLQLAGQLHAKHKQMSELLVAQESVLGQVQENLSQVIDARTNSEQDGTMLLQDVFNLNTSVQEQRRQLSDLEEEFIARIRDTT